MGLMPLWLVGNFRVVLCRGDGPKAGCLVTFTAVVAAHRWVLPDSGYGVGNSIDPGS